MFKCGIVVGGLAAATLLGTFAAGPALASTGSPHQIPVVIHEAAPTGAALPDPGTPDPGSGIVPGVNDAVGSLLSGLGLSDLATLVSGTPAAQNPGGPIGGLGGLLSSLNGSNGLPDLSKLLGGSNGLPDLSKLLNGQNGQPDLGKLVGLLVISKILGGSNPLANPLNGQNGLPDLGLLGGFDISKMLGGLGGSNPLGNLLNGSNNTNALSALGNLINGAKPSIGG